MRFLFLSFFSIVWAQASNFSNAAENVVILNSSPSTTTLISPAGQAIGLEPYHNA